MKWHYRCPKCNNQKNVEWAKRTDKYKCNKTNSTYVPPTPSDQKDAYVDTHEWPTEMETVVVLLKGKNCTVPGCGKSYETLDHRVPYSKGGHTSADNLFPMCKDHNESKGDSDYALWLRSK